MSDPLADAIKGALTYHHLAPPTHMVEDATAAVRTHLAAVFEEEEDARWLALDAAGCDVIDSLRVTLGIGEATGG